MVLHWAYTLRTATLPARHIIDFIYFIPRALDVGAWQSKADGALGVFREGIMIWIIVWIICGALSFLIEVGLDYKATRTNNSIVLITITALVCFAFGPFSLGLNVASMIVGTIVEWSNK